MVSCQYLLDRQNGLCHWCKRKLIGPANQLVSKYNIQELKDYATRDHIVPQSKGGKNGSYNLVAACVPCNWFKSDLMPDEWLEKLGQLQTEQVA